MRLHPNVKEAEAMGMDIRRRIMGWVGSKAGLLVAAHDEKGPQRPVRPGGPAANGRDGRGGRGNGRPDGRPEGGAEGQAPMGPGRGAFAAILVLFLAMLLIFFFQTTAGKREITPEEFRKLTTAQQAELCPEAVAKLPTREIPERPVAMRLSGLEPFELVA